MDKAEKLMASFQGINYIFDPSMPDGQKGLYIDKHVYLNPRQTSEELTDTVAEEIAHYLTSSGDLISLSSENKNNEQGMLVLPWSSLQKILLLATKSVFQTYGNARSF